MLERFNHVSLYDRFITRQGTKEQASDFFDRIDDHSAFEARTIDIHGRGSQVLRQRYE